jgi:hypothetical protein
MAVAPRERPDVRLRSEDHARMLQMCFCQEVDACPIRPQHPAEPLIPANTCARTEGPVRYDRGLEHPQSVRQRWLERCGATVVVRSRTWWQHRGRLCITGATSNRPTIRLNAFRVCAYPEVRARGAMPFHLHGRPRQRHPQRSALAVSTIGASNPDGKSGMRIGHLADICNSLRTPSATCYRCVTALNQSAAKGAKRVTLFCEAMR